jgi:class 3 adenylate cyclase
VRTFISKTIFPLLLILATGQWASAQTEKIRQLEESLRGAEAARRAEILLALADAHLSAGLYPQAAARADEAGDLAQRLRLPALRATALNREGKALMLSGKRKAANAFEQSLRVLRDSPSPDKSLALDNLDQLRTLAQRSGRDRDLANIEAQIARLRSGGTLAEAANTDARQALQQELSATQQQLASEQTAFREKQATLLQESQALQAKLAEREAALDQMSEAQMKTAMLVMEQRLLLDSVFYRAGMDSLAVSNANLALREAESNRKFNYAIMGVLLLLAGGSTFSFVRARQNAQVLKEKNKVIREEQERSETLLLNILPSLVADELKKQGRTNARYFDDVSVLFADFVNFSKITEQLSPQQLVSELDTCFQEFDKIIAYHRLEKIKTIGDAYMCAGGLPDGGGAQLREMISAARDMQSWLFEWNAQRELAGKPRFDARIGIHRGPVVPVWSARASLRLIFGATRSTSPPASSKRAKAGASTYRAKPSKS